MLAVTLLVLPATVAHAAPPAVSQWVQHLRSTDLRERLSAQYDYSTLARNPAESATALLAELENQDPVVREHAAAALGELAASPDVVVPGLLQALRDPTPAVQSQAALALAKVGEPAGREIISQLLSAEGLANPTEKAVRWDDYAVASLMLMQERAAPAISDGLIRLAQFAKGCVVQSDEELERYYREGRAAYSGGDLKFQILDNLARQMNAPGARDIATRLIDRASQSDQPTRAKLEHLAYEILVDSDGSSYFDADRDRTDRLAAFVAAHQCGYGQSSATSSLGDISIAVVRELLRRGDLEQAGTLIGGIRVKGPAAEPWVPIIEQFLVDERKPIRDGALRWLDRSRSIGLPLSERLLLRLANSPDDQAAIIAARYLQEQGSGSLELLQAYENLLGRTGLELSLRIGLIQSLGSLAADVPEAEGLLANLAMTEAAATEPQRSCWATEALAEIGPRTEESRLALLSAIHNGLCVWRSVAALRRSGLSADQILAAADVGPGEENNRVRSLVQLELEDEGPPFEPGFARPDDLADGQAGMSEAALLALIETEGWLSLRDRAVEIQEGSGRVPYWITPARSLDDPIAKLEELGETEFDQTSPIFGALVDLKIFQLVQNRLASATSSRLLFAYPKFPDEVAAAAYMRDGYTSLLPKWPWGWPPPRYSSWTTLPMDKLPSNATIGTVFRRLLHGLEGAGYYDNRLYGIPAGVAVVTHLEQTTADGIALEGPDRWRYGAGSAGQISYARYFAEAFMGIRSHYRLFAFFLTKQANIGGGTSTLPLEQARNPSVDGGRVLPPEIAAVTWQGFYFHVVTYRFNKVNSRVVPLSSDVPTRDQLKRAGLLLSLSGRT